MKRTNVIVDMDLLEEARRESGERTYSGTIAKALAEFVRVKRLRRHLDSTFGMGDEAFAPGYLEWYDKEHRIQKTPVQPLPRRASASEHRLPKKKTSRRGPR